MIIDLQRRLAEAGRIRIGQQVQTANGKSRPAKLSTFRLTSQDRRRVDQAAGLFGGRPQPWQAPAGQQWEVITETDALDVIVPPSDMAFSQHYELWSAGGCKRRCDGRQETISDGPCLCDPDERECDIHTRLSVMLRDLPGLGVWRIDTSGYYAAVELQAAVEIIQLAAGRGQMLPARLRLEQRHVKRPDQPRRDFAVPVLDIEVSPGQLMAGPTAGQLQTPAQQLPPGQPVDGTAPLTPVPQSLPAGPQSSVAEQMAAVDNPEPRPRRSNAAQPIPATGIAPRTAAQAAHDAPPPPTAPPDEREQNAEPTPAVKRKVAIACRKAGLDDQGRHAVAHIVSGGRTTSTKELNVAESEQALLIADLIAGGHARIHLDGPNGHPIPLKPNSDPINIPLNVGATRAWLDQQQQQLLNPDDADDGEE